MTFEVAAPAPSHAAAVTGSVLRIVRSAVIRYAVYTSDVASARRIPSGATSTSPPPTITTALPPSARRRATNSRQPGGRRSSAIVASMTQTGYR